eukprot:COSAG05_NODE_147_length_16383_cov_266.102555_15_plen_151_part_00
MVYARAAEGYLVTLGRDSGGLGHAILAHFPSVSLPGAATTTPGMHAVVRRALLRTDAPVTAAPPEPMLSLSVRAQAVGHAPPPFSGETGGFAAWRRRRWAELSGRDTDDGQGSDEEDGTELSERGAARVLGYPGRVRWDSTNFLALHAPA